ncbi:MAG TPA: IS630 family transposase [Myxococcota bacterium]|nr:IS630 family transposase [Myxococcota bacterium]
MPSIVKKILLVRDELVFLRDFSTDATERRRASILLARSAGLTQRDAAFAAGVARSTVQRTERLFESAELDGLTDGRRRNGYRVLRRPDVLALLPRLAAGQPPDYGWSRSTWTIEVLCLEVQRQLDVLVSEAQMGRLLRKAGYRRVRPKQTIALAPPDHAAQIAQLRATLAEVDEDDVVLYEDEVDIHYNPKIGPDWAPAGVRKTLVTPGRNKKLYIAVAFDPTTQELVAVDGPSKSSDLFIALLHELVERFEGRRIHLVVDNYIIHRSKKTQRALEKLDGKVVLYSLPPYSPDYNPIERVWLDLHTAVTRNHR